MTLSELVEDAFLSALEAGAAPPLRFNVHLPRTAFADVRDEGFRVQVAGYTLTVLIENGWPALPEEH